MLMEFLQFTFQGFWTFIGVTILLGIVVNAPTQLVKTFLHYRAINKLGWPEKSKSWEKNDADDNS